MCATKPPEPQAPPAPLPVRDSQIDARLARQNASRDAATSGYESTVLTGPGGIRNETPSAALTLNGSGNG